MIWNLFSGPYLWVDIVNEHFAEIKEHRHDKAKELYQLYPGRWTKIGKELEKVYHEEFKYRFH